MTAPSVVLLIEDAAILLLDVETALEEEGFEVISAINGAEGMAKFDRHKDDLKALVTDVSLGTGPTGWDVARHVRTAVPTMPVIYMSGHGSDDWAAHGVPNSIMISKPFVMTQIITGLATLLNEGSSSLAPEDGRGQPNS
ncbi:response regulator [Mesorhizobium sp. WSM2561]|uniref:response regulator n=1 Tax=Mesorhizobium sp. WSM2561 TaxID=1040985 RepID=UPI0004886DBC|nr:response regulator [Mesorhizobium sp. WSM2561]